jgi:hypothetical protein
MMRHLVSCLVGIGLLTALILASAGPAGAARPETCSGTFDSPGFLSGSYSNVTIDGVCGVSGPTTVSGNLILGPSSALVAVFSGGDLTVNGHVSVKHDATLIAGCDPEQSPCIDDPTGSATTTIAGNLIATQALGVVVHDSTIGGNVVQVGGGGGVTCEPVGFFTQLESPAFSTYSDSRIGGHITISGDSSCWLGITRVDIGGSVQLLHNQLADPDAIEVLDNTIGGNIVCQQNSMVWDSADITANLYPRLWEPNTVSGHRVGQCVMAPPIDSPSGVSPGAF